MKLALTPDQQTELLHHLRPGHVLIAKIAREAFDGTNPQTSGTLLIDFKSIPETALHEIRAAIQKYK